MAGLIARGLKCRGEIGLVALLAIVAAVPRLANLLGRDPFVDEAGWLRWSALLFRFDDPRTLWLPTADGLRPPLFFWFEVAALQLVDNGFLAGRLVSALSGVATVLVVYGLGRALLSREAALIAALWWAVSPLSVFFSGIAVDDAILTLWTAIVALASVRMVRRPGLLAGGVLGLSIGLAILTKPLALLVVPFPLVAWLTVGPRRLSPRLLAALTAAIVTASLVAAPLASWIPQLRDMVNVFADTSLSAGAGDPSVAARLFRFDLLQKNVPTAVGWLNDYVGWPLVGLAAVGAVLAIARRDGRGLYLVCIWALPFVILMDRTVVLYSRYLLFFAFPLFCLAASALAWLVDLAVGLADRGRALEGQWPWRRWAVAAASVGACAIVLPMTYDLMTAPERATLPTVDRMQYFNQWYAFFGLGRISAVLAAAGRAAPATVLIPADQYPQQHIADALQEYLRGDPSVRFIQDKSLNEGWSLCPLRSWLTSPTPAFIVIDGARSVAGGPPSIPAYTRTLQAALARDLPEIEPVLNIPRPEGDAWLAIYRLDGSANAAGQQPCSTPNRSFGTGWHEIDKLLGGTEPARWTGDTAQYAEGPLPAGWYRPFLYAQSVGSFQSVSLRLNGTSVGSQPAPSAGSWSWVEGDAPVWVPAGETAHLEVSIEANQSNVGDLRLIVGRLVLQREADASVTGSLERPRE